METSKDGGPRTFGIGVRRLRVSYVACRAHDRLLEIGQPVEYAAKVRTLGDVRGLSVSLPFAPDTPTDLAFWDGIMERSNLDFRKTNPESWAKRFRDADVPLRHRGELSAARRSLDGMVELSTASLEAQLRMHGVVVVVTVDLRFKSPIPIIGVANYLDDLAEVDGIVEVDGQKMVLPVGDVASEFVDTVIKRLSLSNKKCASGRMLKYRLATVVGDAGDSICEVPMEGDEVNAAMHRMAVGGDGSGSVSLRPFVPRWAGPDFEYKIDPEQLIYVWRSGSSALSVDLGKIKNRRAGHRFDTLLMAHLMALSAVVELAASGDSDSPIIQPWAKDAIKVLGRLYGPARCFMEWGLLPYAYLERLGVIGVVEQIGERLYRNKDIRHVGRLS